MIVCDGNSRRDTYALQADGSWTRREFFRKLSKAADDDSYTLRFSDTGTRLNNFSSIATGCALMCFLKKVSAS